MNDQQPIATPICDADEADLEQKYGLKAFVRSSTGRTLERELVQKELSLATLEAGRKAEVDHWQNNFQSLQSELSKKEQELVTILSGVEIATKQAMELKDVEIERLTTELKRWTEAHSDLHAANDANCKTIAAIQSERDKLQDYINRCEESLRLCSCVFGIDPSDGEGTHPEEISDLVQDKVAIMAKENTRLREALEFFMTCGVRGTGTGQVIYPLELWNELFEKIREALNHSKSTTQ